MVNSNGAGIAPDFPRGTPSPAGLNASGAELWASVTDPYDLDVHERVLLLQACRAADRLDLLAGEIGDGPAITVSTRGEQIAHPALVESRAQSLVLARMLASLRLPTGEHADGSLVRPQRRGAARGAYTVRVAR